MQRLSRRFKVIEGSHYIDKTAAADLLGVSEQTLGNYRRRPNPPPFNEELMMYPMRELGVWMREHFMFISGKGGAHKYRDLFKKNGYVPKEDVAPVLLPGMANPDEDQDTRLKRLKADKAEIELKKMTAELIPVDEIEIAMSEMLSRVKMKILSLPTSISPLISGKQNPIEIQEVIEKNVRSALEELSGDWKAELDDEEEDE